MEESMSRLTVGKLRGLQQVANAKGILTVCAIDHRESLRQALNKKKPENVSYQQMVDFKLDLVSVIAPFASAVLLDPIFGAGQAITSGLLPGQTGLLVSAEKTGYSGNICGKNYRTFTGLGRKESQKDGCVRH